jgi:hypothetical protein
MEVIIKLCRIKDGMAKEGMAKDRMTKERMAIGQKPYRQHTANLEIPTR